MRYIVVNAIVAMVPSGPAGCNIIACVLMYTSGW